MKKNSTMRVAALLLALTLITSCFVGGTFAKYTSSAFGSDTATVAKWDINFTDNTDTKLGANFDLDLFGGDTVAPGSSGSFTFKVVNTATEVNATYDVTYTLTNTSNIPIQFKVGEATLDPDLTKFNVTDQTIAAGSTDTITVEWEWVSTDDATDTGFGESTTLTPITVEINLAAEQVIS